MNRSMRSDEQTFTFTLHKDLIENEEVCPNCKGLGLVVRDNSYGIEGKHGRITQYYISKGYNVNFEMNDYIKIDWKKKNE